MSRSVCAKEWETLKSYRRGRVDPALDAHAASCPVCARAIAAERALAQIRSVIDDRPFPSSAALRLEGELRREELRLARRARVQIGLHAAALAISVALFLAVRATAVGPARALGSAGSACAILVVGLSMLNLVRTAQDLTSRP